MRPLRSTLALLAAAVFLAGCDTGSDSSQPEAPGGGTEPSVTLLTPPEFVSAADWTSQQSGLTRNLQWVSRSSVVEYQGRVWMVMSPADDKAQIVGVRPHPPFDTITSETFPAFVGPDDYDGDPASPETLPLLTVIDGTLAVTYRTPGAFTAKLNYQRLAVAPGGVTMTTEPSTLGIPDPVVRSTGSDLIAYNEQNEMQERWSITDDEWQRERQQMYGGRTYYPHAYIGQDPVYANSDAPEVFFRDQPHRVYEYDTGSSAYVAAASGQGAVVVTTDSTQFLDVRNGAASLVQVSTQPACDGIAAPVLDPETGYMAIDGPALWDVNNHAVAPISVNGNCPVAIALSGKRAWVSQQGQTGFTLDTRMVASAEVQAGDPWPSRTRGPIYVTANYGFFPLTTGEGEKVAIARLKP